MLDYLGQGAIIACMIKRIRVYLLVCLCVLNSFISCGKGETVSSSSSSSSYEIKYSDIVLGKTAIDLKASIRFITHRTDMAASEYVGRSWKDYLEDFNRLYPGIQVSVEALTNYSASATDLLNRGDWGDIMMIPIMEKNLYSRYFIPYGTVADLSRILRFADQFAYDGRVYGIASAGNVQGIIYNKKVFKDAGITKLPKTPDEFLNVLRQVKRNTKAIPLYTNYVAAWPLEQWDFYITSTATGDSGFLNYTMLHRKNPFSDPGDSSGAYNVYRILYQAAREGLIEDDFTTTDWDGCKGMMNRGDIATMALGSWAFSQIQNAGPNPDDIGYMPFPIQVDGVQIASALPDNNFGINVKSEGVKKLASMIFVKWMVENSGFQYNEGEIPILLSDNDFADVYEAFDGIEIMVDAPPVDGDADLLEKLNADSGLFINQGGSKKIQELIEHAAAKDLSYVRIIEDWNERWSKAQEKNGVELN